LLKAAQARHPADFWLNFLLGCVLHKAKRGEEAVGYYRVALAVRPDTAAVYLNLGAALAGKGQREDAIRAYRRAIALDPGFAPAHNNLGTVLAAQGRRADAIRAYQQAITLDPGLAQARNNLGNALQDQGRLDDAIREYHKAIELDPGLARAHSNLGAALYAQGRLDDAIREYRKAIALNPSNAPAYSDLGAALYARGQRDDAIRAFQKAIALDPRDVEAHSNLGNALQQNGRLDDAVREYRKAIALDPGFAQAHGSLGEALLKQGRFTEAQAATRRCLSLLPPNHLLRQSVTQQLRLCQRLLQMGDRLPALLRGEIQPADAAERVALAQLCLRHKGLYAASARFYGDAFAEPPPLADDLREGHRFNAACAAARAGVGQGHEAGPLDARECARLRRQALDWLWADLAAWARVLDKGPPQDRSEVQRTLRLWQQDPDLAGLRDRDDLAQLSAAERQTCRRLWADVDALLQRASHGAAGERPRRQP
jgi:tetratricopeptide (TPR) repeat protein